MGRLLESILIFKGEQMTDIMIDLEALGTKPDAAIIAIGAVSFDLQAKTLGDEFYIVVDLASAMEAGGTVDASTILWWMQRSEEARGEFKRKGVLITDALGNFSRWIELFGFGQINGVWGNGATFDNVILRSAFNRLEIPVPWTYRQDRCFRTVKALHPQIEVPLEGTPHNALADAKWQARYLMEVLG